jgi:hypothetical protein
MLAANRPVEPTDDIGGKPLTCTNVSGPLPRGGGNAGRRTSTRTQVLENSQLPPADSPPAPGHVPDSAAHQPAVNRPSPPHPRIPGQTVPHPITHQPAVSRPSPPPRQPPPLRPPTQPPASPPSHTAGRLTHAEWPPGTWTRVANPADLPKSHPRQPVSGFVRWGRVPGDERS